MNSIEDMLHRAPAPGLRHSLAQRALGVLDRRLRERLGVVEYSDSSRCVFRIQLIASDEAIMLGDGTLVRAGERLIDLHIWNEHVPSTGDQGPTMGFIRRLNGQIDFSLAELADHLEKREDLNDVKAIRGNLVFASRSRIAQLARIASAYGFEHIPRQVAPTIAERLHIFGENILVSMLVFMRNPKTLRRDTLARDRTRTFLSRQALQRRYPPSGRSGGEREEKTGRVGDAALRRSL
ncbi:YkoP family protein [Methylocystis heyeri]|uniref:YkoP-like domain-containing protein n=1 Tax=Methylocystis heyeri TaxID=391905 RepID=A0A6B8KJR9_9HYPH|nr:hypothetical protein [Methylocystis heyeri]QGM47175.1 hypothetical protein H2LOC_016560 [Methylocystis heyeri]